MKIDTHGHHHLHNHNFPQKMQRCEDHIHALEEERLKIKVFERELPLCLHLVTQAIEACKQQLSGTTTTMEYNLNVQSEYSEPTSSDAPVLEEFIPIKRASSSHSDGEEQQSSRKPPLIETLGIARNQTGLDLFSYGIKPQSPNQGLAKRVDVVEVKRNGTVGAFHPFKKEKIGQVASCTVTPPPVSMSVPPASTSSSAETGGGGSKKTEKEGQCDRKSRRCWSTELHRKFLDALQQLGGSHLATPKQIRELMKVDGLTNDEVKSHLQKYRLHSRRPSHSMQNSSQTPQFVVVGGIWVPPEYATMATTATSGSGEASGAVTSNGVYAPVAKLAMSPYRGAMESSKQKLSPLSEDGEGSLSEGRGRSHSPATSSSTHTTSTASPAY